MKNFNDFRQELMEEGDKEIVILNITGKILAARERKGLSQRALSEISGIPQKTISRIESGKDVPKMSTLITLTEALDLEFSLKEKSSDIEQAATL
ncbi:helix-turn-helix domain-containing protein [Halalkalibacillus halophilus]|uniref:helix-turn-helix domain-containing protein n=1 Tax=Halalkalibacillus halophilus TaxID=392827 RepID=UPI000427658C|nr:helix-turn-helix transcriptional regulator [Halalkalibacillus halophilus]